MNLENNPGMNFILFILFSIIFFLLVDKYISMDNQFLIAAAIFFIVSGVWGNAVKMVLLKIPSGPKSYKIINYAIIGIGIVFALFGTYSVWKSK